jgi:hypothetical protein
MKNTILFLVMAVALTTQTLFAQVPSYVPTNGLVGYWPFNGNPNDESGNGNNGTVSGAILTTDRFGNNNGAYYFDGLTSYISGDGVNLPQGDSSRTVSLWVKTSGGFDANTGGNTGVVFNYGTLEYKQRFGVLLDDNSLNNYLCTQNNDYPTFNPVSNNSWTNIVWVYSNTNLYLYINGSLTTTSTILNINTTAQNFMFGNTVLNSLGQYEKYKGAIDDVVIWNRALTQQEITNIYNSSLPQTACLPANVPTTGLVGYWPFCGNANDESGNGNNGTNNGATLTADRFGNSNSAYNFNGISNKIEVDDNAQFQFTTFSVSLWVNANSGFSLVNKSDWSNGSLEAFNIGLGANLLNSSIKMNSNCLAGVGWNNITTNTGSLYNNWKHIVVVFDGLNVRHFINGVLVNSQPLVGLMDTCFGGKLKFGAWWQNSPDYLNGKLDDIGIWNRALTQEEITNLFNINQCITNITVTDTLIINVGQLSFNDPVTWANNITIAPNPASSQININFNNITNLNGGTLKIINSLGQQVATTPITTSGTNSTMQLATWGGTGMYFVQIINPQGQIVDIKKIILQ